jgi:hypothetical protein
MAVVRSRAHCEKNEAVRVPTLQVVLLMLILMTRKLYLDLEQAKGMVLPRTAARHGKRVP